MAVVSNQALTEMSTRKLPGSKRRPARKADSLTAIWEPRRRASMAYYTWRAVQAYTKLHGITSQKIVL
jgi:hypothetical protein